MATVDKLAQLFLSAAGRDIYDSAARAIADYGMEAAIKRGVLVGFSGGPDSVMLLLFLLEYRRRGEDFPIVCVHINHSIRGVEAERDEVASRRICELLGIEFHAFRYDVPAIARECGKGLEETARDVRYSCFNEIISGRNDVSAIAIAHNATDNLETVILNMMRGAGARGVAGIPPVRDSIVRPLIYVSKRDITAALDSFGFEYVTDSTNSSLEYARNRIRNRVIPELRKIAASPENMAARLSRNLRRDDDYITGVAREFLVDSDERGASREGLLGLHISVFSRVVALMAQKAGAFVTEQQLEKIHALISSGDFSYDICGARFVLERGRCRVLQRASEPLRYEIPLSLGVNDIPEYEAELLLSEEDITVSSSNVYKFSIQANLSSAIINGRLFLRPKMDGDTVFFGGHTRKLKKLYNDYDVPPTLRDSIPVLCDGAGVVWLPGIGVRDDGGDKKRQGGLRACLSVGLLPDENYDTRFHIPTEFHNKKDKNRK